MSEYQDIRVWAAANGWDVQSKGRLPAQVKEAWEAAQNGQPEPDPEPFVITATPDSPPVTAGDAADFIGHPDGPPERKPEPPKRRGLFAPRPPRQLGARPAHKRVSIENILGSGWALGAMALARSPQALPIAKVMDMQAPVAGIIGEELLKGTLIDRVLQPLARGGRKAELATALVGPPLIVGAMTANPKLFPVLRPMLKMTMMSWMEISEPAMKTVAKRQERWAEKFGDVDIDAMIDLLWADMPVSDKPSEQEEENIRRARGE